MFGDGRITPFFFFEFLLFLCVWSLVEKRRVPRVSGESGNTKPDLVTSLKEEGSLLLCQQYFMEKSAEGGGAYIIY